MLAAGKNNEAARALLGNGSRRRQWCNKFCTACDTDVHGLGSVLGPPTGVRGQTVWSAHAGAHGYFSHMGGIYFLLSQMGVSFISRVLVFVFTICGPDGLRSL